MKQKVKKDLMRQFVARKIEEYYNETYRNNKRGQNLDIHKENIGLSERMEEFI